MALQLTLSCDSDKTETGPTLIHSTGVQDYKIPPEIIRILQESLTNDLLSDHADGVLCQESSQRVLDILSQNGFTLQNETNEDDKTLWTVAKESGGDSEQPVAPQDADSTPNDGNQADADAGDNGGDGEAGNKEEEGGGEEEQQQQEEQQQEQEEQEQEPEGEE
ncbi:unnamed protein product [Rotaria magnacalcarata]|uniref:Uncharacterized protein n=2 Tax=Rotaria magnacalcarata TaxID=392030 RepID=A0A815QHE4_9BILA|nr:unnamed protein product [Rotaria magnacalcarata]CAF1662365.1 unnamed protein product [Rotaria magnacalcarata]CAF2035959.1 unnamed protein product [Rotaria magnacalcarata]CAF3879660.1 unnamed protein product [Rotaria magnacalcarata]CAF4439583.1 unnamed protein product [Rotaria magnacalcarata]